MYMEFLNCFQTVIFLIFFKSSGLFAHLPDNLKTARSMQNMTGLFEAKFSQSEKL